MPEVISWPEGSIYVWTGSATASAVPGYAQNIQATLTWGWDNFWTVSGEPRDTLTGKRADMTVGGLMTFDAALTNIMQSETAVHIHIRRDALGASAGYYFYSGRIDQHIFAGREGEIYQYSITYHSNIWSAYG